MARGDIVREVPGKRTNILSALEAVQEFPEVDMKLQKRLDEIKKREYKNAEMNVPSVGAQVDIVLAESNKRPREEDAPYQLPTPPATPARGKGRPTLAASLKAAAIGTRPITAFFNKKQQ